MSDNKKISPSPSHALELAFDVGHSSIGWAVLANRPANDESVELMGCGAVIFRADDCLASSRRGYRRQRRHIRSTRQRIERLKRLILHLGVMTREQLDRPGCAWPWKLAARALSTKTGHNQNLLLTWPELWDVLRWYAHNRGYDGNARWSGDDLEADETEKVENANALMREHSAGSMAETFCSVCGIDPLGARSSSNPDPLKRFKVKNAAFPRHVVEGEVKRILDVHFGALPGLDASFRRALCGENPRDKHAWKTIPVPDLKLPERYEGGLLFGQLVPRFDNRLISTCPFTGQKVPTRHCREFLNYRWAMRIADVQVACGTEKLRSLTPVERAALDAEARKTGSFTEKRFKDAVRNITGCSRDNLDQMLMHPDAAKALLVDPVQDQITRGHWNTLFPLLSPQAQKRAKGQLWLGKPVTLRALRGYDVAAQRETSAFDAEIARIIEAANTRKKKKETPVGADEILDSALRLKKLDGRAPYCRTLLIQAYHEALAGKHPKAVGGCLYITDEVRKSELNRPIAEKTNNHLIRHRLLILERLANDIVTEYAKGDKSLVSRITIEVNRDLREMSGKTAKEIKQDMGLRLSNHSSVSTKLAKALAENGVTLSAGLIRKARIADDLGWVCPYTGKQFEPMDLVTRAVDKDHIIPRSLRPSDSLDSLAVTFSEVNKWKGARTAMQFIAEEGGKTVPGDPRLSLRTPADFKRFVEDLESYRGHDDDKRRKQKRKQLLLLSTYEDKEFTPRDLTQTSQLVRMGAQALERLFSDQKTPPIVISLPGSVTGTIRKAWKVIGCLATANPGVLDTEGNLRSKTEIRDITHLHHALDACVLAYASHFIPNTGRVWELIVKRRLSPAEQAELYALGIIQYGTDGQWVFTDLRDAYKQQMRNRLAELRVVQHIPARMTGLHAEQNTWRVLKQEPEGEVTLCQYRRGPDGKRIETITTEKAIKLLGPSPTGGTGKLKKLKGALVIPDNYGVALDPLPTIIPFHKVPQRLRALRLANKNKNVRVLRNGQVIAVPEGIYKGLWRIFSVKNSQAGITLDLGAADIVRLASKGHGMKREVRLATLLRDKIRILESRLCGVTACPTTSSA